MVEPTPPPEKRILWFPCSSPLKWTALLQPDEDSATSPTFPTVDVKTVLPEYVERAWKAGSSVVRHEFEHYL
ncbi:MAG: hypothetical protein AAFQ89_01800 [Cyanobacteria bacterium J06626_18]